MKSWILLKLSSFVVLIVLLISTPSFAATEFQSCPMPSDEKLVCAVVMCVPGLLISESRPKCLAINKKFAVYLATLGFWKKPPNCKMRDLNCTIIGEAKTPNVDVSFCNALSLVTEQNSCKAALGQSEKSYCDTFTDNEKRARCETTMGRQ